MTIYIDVDDAQILHTLNELASRVSNIRPALREIGEDLKESTQQRFVTTHAPDGSRWELNSVLSTLLYKEGDRPLTNLGTLGATIDYQIDNNELQISSPLKYAAMMQFGGTKTEFPNLWGDIPARPFLGLSDEDRDGILHVLRDYLDGV